MIRKLTQRLCHEYLPPDLAANKSFKLWHNDGSGLYVHVHRIRSKKPGAVRRRYWVLRYTTRNPLGAEVARPNTSHDYVIGSLGRYPSLQWAIDEARRLNVLVAEGKNPIEIRKKLREQARAAETVETLAKLDVTVHFKAPWEKPVSCSAAGESKSATRVRSCWITHILPKIGKMLVSDVRVTHINEVLTSVAASNGTNVAAVVRGILHAAFNRAKKWDLIPDGLAWSNPVSASSVYSTKKRRDVVMSRQQYHDAVCAAEELLGELDAASRYGASHIRQTLAFLVAAETGRRPGEIYSLERRHVNYAERTAYLPRTKATKHDDAKVQGQTFGLSARAMAFLRQAEAIAGKSPFVFPADTSTGHIDKARWAWERIRQKGGIPEDVVMYTARHRFVSEVARQGGDVKAASVQLGHSDLSMTHNYMVTDGGELAGFAESVSVGLARDRRASREWGTVGEC